MLRSVLAAGLLSFAASIASGQLPLHPEDLAVIERVARQVGLDASVLLLLELESRAGWVSLT
jgi:hypothetical protein